MIYNHPLNSQQHMGRVAQPLGETYTAARHRHCATGMG